MVYHGIAWYLLHDIAWYTMVLHGIYCMVLQSQQLCPVFLPDCILVDDCLSLAALLLKYNDIFMLNCFGVLVQVG